MRIARGLLIIWLMPALLLPSATAAGPNPPQTRACGDDCCCPTGNCACAHPAPDAPDAPLPLPATSEAGSTRAVLFFTTGPMPFIGTAHVVRRFGSADLHVPTTDHSSARLCRWIT